MAARNLKPILTAEELEQALHRDVDRVKKSIRNNIIGMAVLAVVMIGYLTTRWRQSGWHPGAAIVVSALIRASYHLYQGFGGFISNLVFGLLLGWLYQRTRRLWPLVIAHTVIDITAFVGYSLLAGVVGWL